MGMMAQKGFLVMVLLVLLGAIIPSSVFAEEEEKISTAAGQVFGNYVFDSVTGTIMSGSVASGNLVIPSEINGVAVKCIGSRAFSSEYLYSVVIPEGVTTIDAEAFHSCTKLTSVILPESLRSLGDRAFENCCSLKSIKLPNRLTSIGIGAFEFCQSLTDIDIPSSVSNIGYYPFLNCCSLASVNVDSGNQQFSSEEGVLFNKERSKLIAYPPGKPITTYAIPNTVTLIDTYAFITAHKLASVIISNNVTSIGAGAFLSCSALANVVLPGSVSVIEERAFFDCGSLASIIIPESVTSIGSSVFKGCALKEITLPESITRIDTNTFQGCNNLQKVTIPNSVTSIGDSAFQGCQRLTNISIPDSVLSIERAAFNGCTSLDNITIPDSVTNLGEQVFANCSALTNVKLPKNLTAIPSHTFMECRSLKSYTIPENITSVGTAAFWKCVSLEQMIIPKNVLTIENMAFRYCYGLRSIRFNSTTTQILDDSNYLEYSTIPTTTTIIGYDPSTVKDYAIAHGNTFKSLNTPSTSEERDINEKFNYNPNEYSQTLAERAAVLSMLAYDDYVCNVVTKTNYRASASRNIDPVFLTCELISQKFEDIKPCNYRDANNNPDNNPDNVSFSLAHKKVLYNNQMTNLTVIVIRGTNGIEWQGNMDITGDTFDGSLMNHWSFDNAKVDVMNQLKQYLTDHQIENTILLVTGHSRGAGVANLVSNDLTNDNPNDGIGDVFAYTFATPNVTLNPDYSKTNIFNFCFTDDFVPQVPLNAWGYGKNGITDSVIAENAYKTNVEYKNEMDNFVKISANPHSSANFNYNSTIKLIDYTKNVWLSCNDFYNKPVKCSRADDPSSNLHEFFKYYIAKLAYEPSYTNIINFALVTRFYPDFLEIAEFFVRGTKLNTNINDTHQMFNYYSALRNGVFENNITLGGGSANSLETNEFVTVSETTTSSPTNANATEIKQLKDFANLDDNLSKLGWNLDDVSTWSGVLWSDETENRVVSLDLKFKDLTGALDLGGFSGLETVDVRGNNLTAISLTDCNALTGLNCAYNQMTQLDLSDLSGIRTLDCNGNQLQTLNINGCTALEELDCSNNQLADLNVSANTALTNLYCSSNNLLSLDLTANTLLTNFDCEGNYLDVQEGSEMYSRIQTILGMDGGWVSYEYQKIKENVVFNSDEVAKLSEFANQGDNLSNLQWNLGKPSEWYGIEWIMSGTEYRVNRLMLDNLDLTGSLNVSGMTALSSFSCNNNQLTSINAANCEKLGYLSCYNTGINELNISGCSALNHLECSNNYLDLSVGSQLKDNIETIRLKEGSIVSCDPQKIAASKDQFNAEEVSLLLAFAGNNGNSELLNWNVDKPGEWAGVTWKKIDGEYRVTALTFNTKPVTGSLDLSNFGWLTMLDCSLTKISAMRLPSSLTAIEANTFYNCAALTDVTLPESLTVIGDEAFYNCSALKDLKLPESMATIGEGAFAGCKSLTTMEIPANTISLGNYGFYECTGLVTIQFNTSTIVIGDDPSTIPVTAIVRGNDPSTAKDYAVKYGQTFETIASNTKRGDVDGNGEIQAYDALMALQIATGKKIGTAVEIKAADVDNSGSVQAYDALRILQYATGKIQAF